MHPADVFPNAAAAVFSHNAVGLHNAAIFFRHESPSRQVAGNKKRSPSCVDPTRWCRFINGFFETSESEEVYLSNSRDAIASMDKIAPWNGAVAMQSWNVTADSGNKLAELAIDTVWNGAVAVWDVTADSGIKLAEYVVKESISTNKSVKETLNQLSEMVGSWISLLYGIGTCVMNLYKLVICLFKLLVLCVIVVVLFTVLKGGINLVRLHKYYFRYYNDTKNGNRLVVALKCTDYSGLTTPKKVITIGIPTDEELKMYQGLNGAGEQIPFYGFKGVIKVRRVLFLTNFNSFGFIMKRRKFSGPFIISLCDFSTLSPNRDGKTEFLFRDYIEKNATSL
eukprot:scaffold20971_cov225-Skeletonema_marinoi.AAC.2